MIWIDIGTPSAEPVTLGEVKAFLRIERDDEDALLMTLLAAAREMVEAQTGLILRECAYRLAFDGQADRRRVDLSRRPVTAISATVAYDEIGMAQTLDPAGIKIEQGPLRSALILPEGLASAGANGFEIEIQAGLAASSVPETIKLAILRLAAVSFELRSAVSTDQQPAVMPPLVRGLLAPFRSHGL